MARKFWALVIDNEGGLDVTLHRTQEAAEEALWTYVDAWWDHELCSMKRARTIPQPTDHTKAIEAYFEHVEDERAVITELDAPTEED